MAQPTYVIVLTPPGRGAVASVRVEGPQAIQAVAECFLPARPKALRRVEQGQILFGRWGRHDGEEVVVCRPEGLPFSRPVHQGAIHQGADASRLPAIEVHCHGGSVAVRSVVDALVKLGCHEQEWQEWVATQAEDATGAEAWVALAHATTARSAAILLDQFHGALTREIRSIEGTLATGAGEEAMARLRTLLQRADLGLHLTQPWRVVIAGPPNVGKSSLLNALLGYERAIVFDHPGTTRDIVAAAAALEGWPVELSDTAGLHASNDPLEAAGVALAHQQLAAADQVLLVFDASQPWTSAETELTKRWPKALMVHNKCDLAAGMSDRPPGLITSALTGEGIAALVAELASRLAPAPPAASDAVPFTARQIGLLRRALEAAEGGDIAASRRALDETICRDSASSPG